MRLRGPFVCLTAVLLGSLAAAPAQAQSKRGVHQMVINNGAQQTVRYFPNRLSTGEGAALRDLERTQNELAFVRSLQELKREYIRNERIRENQRALAQQAAYGDFISASSYGGYGILGNIAYGYGYPVFDIGYGGFRDVYGLGGYYGLGNYAYGYGPGVGGYGLGGVGGNLAAGDYNMTDERTIKNAVAAALPQQTTAQYAASIERDYDRAVARASSSPTLRVALGLPEGRRREDYLLPTPAAAETPSSKYVITTKDGATYAGNKMEEGKDWITIYTTEGRKVRLRPSEVTKIDEGKPTGVAPAAGG
jgi:hypothetical protein